MTCYLDSNLNNFEILLSRQIIKIHHERTLDNIMVYILKGICLTNLAHGKPKIHSLVQILMNTL